MASYYYSETWAILQIANLTSKLTKKSMGCAWAYGMSQNVSVRLESWLCHFYQWHGTNYIDMYF